MIVKRLLGYIGAALAFCLPLLSMPVYASAAHDWQTKLTKAMAYAMQDSHGAQMKRLEASLAANRTGAAATSDRVRSDMRADSHGFLFNGLPKPVDMPLMT